jgi:hypothetical protein
MRSAALFGLGLKLALGSDRGAKVRFALMSASIAVGVAVIVGAFSVIPAIQARDARVAGLEYFATDGRTDAPDQLILAERDSWFGGQMLQRFLVAPIGDAPIPPGLERLPGPGEVVVSPALRELLQGPQGALLDDRLRGRVVGFIGESGLLHPDELTAYLGVRRSEIEEIERSYVTGFGSRESNADLPVDEAVIQSVIFGSAGVLLPILVFVWTATRLSAGLRDTRLAAIRLAGATPRQVRLLSAVESGLAAIAGMALGFGLFLAARELLALSVELGLEPSDAVPPLAAILGIGIGIPVLAVVVAWLALRRVTGSPLSVVRKAPRRSRIAAPAAVALAMGISQWLFLEWARQRWGDSGAWIGVAFILGAWVLTALGVLGLAPWIGTRAAGLVTRRTESLGAWLGARRLETDGRAAARVSTATVVVVFAAGVAAGYIVYFDGTAGSLRASASLRPETVAVDSWRGDLRQVLDEIAAVDGARQTAALRTTHLVEASTQNYLAGITIFSCRDLPTVLLAAPPNCDTGAILLHNPEESNVLARVSPGDLATFVPYSDSEYVPFAIPVPDRVLSTEFSADNGYDGYVIDEAAAPDELLQVMPVTRILVATDGRAQTVERIREAVSWTDPFPTVLTRSELALGEEGGSVPIRFAIELGTYFALSVAAASLLVSTVGAVQERQKPLAALAALGVPVGALRRSIVVQTMAPLVAGVVLAGVAAAVVVLSSTPDSRPLPWSSLIAPIGRFVALAVMAGLVASALAFPALRRGIRPEALHHE